MVCRVIGMHKIFVVYLQFDNLCAFARSSCQYYLLPLLDFSARAALRNCLATSPDQLKHTPTLPVRWMEKAILGGYTQALRYPFILSGSAQPMEGKGVREETTAVDGSYVSIHQ